MYVIKYFSFNVRVQRIFFFLFLLASIFIYFNFHISGVKALDFSDLSDIKQFEYSKGGGETYRFREVDKNTGILSVGHVFDTNTNLTPGYTHLIISYVFSSAVGTVSAYTDNDFNYFPMARIMVYVNGNNYYCDTKSNYAICPLPNNYSNLNSIYFNYEFYFDPTDLDAINSIYGSIRLTTNFYLGKSITSDVGSIKDSVDNVGDKVSEVKDSIEGEHLDTGNIESSSNDSFDAYNEAESNLNLDGADLSSINLGLNPNVASKVWSINQSFLDVNPKIMAFVVSMLSIGLIKLFLGR